MSHTYRGPVAWSNEHSPPSHMKIVDGRPDPKQRVVWVEAKPDEPDDAAGHWEEAKVTRRKNEPVRVVALQAQAHGTSGTGA